MKQEQVLELLKQMTLGEKVGQLIQVLGEDFLRDNVDITTGPLIYQTKIYIMLGQF